MRFVNAKTATAAAGIGISALLLIGGLGVVQSLRSHDTERLAFELYRTSTEILDGLFVTVNVSLPQRVQGFVVFGGRGEVLATVGIGRPALAVQKPNGYWDEDGLIVYHRQITKGGRQIVVWYDPSALRKEQTWRDLWLFGGLVLLCLLITLSTMLTRRLIRSEERLNDRERLALLGQAARTISHEIQNPLTALELHRQLAAQKVSARGEPDETDAEIARHIDVIRREAERIGGIIREVRRYIHPETAPSTEIDLAKFVPDILRGRTVAYRPDENVPGGDHRPLQRRRSRVAYGNARSGAVLPGRGLLARRVRLRRGVYRQPCRSSLVDVERQGPALPSLPRGIEAGNGHGRRRTSGAARRRNQAGLTGPTGGG
jgi:signal transduction histidine kinase